MDAIETQNYWRQKIYTIYREGSRSRKKLYPYQSFTHLVIAIYPEEFYRLFSRFKNTQKVFRRVLSSPQCRLTRDVKIVGTGSLREATHRLHDLSVHIKAWCWNGSCWLKPGESTIYYPPHQSNAISTAICATMRMDGLIILQVNEGITL